MGFRNRSWVAALALVAAGPGCAAWTYEIYVDGRTDAEGPIAVVRSANELALNGPYRARTHGFLSVQDGHRPEVILTLDRGQIPCRPPGGCDVKVQFGALRLNPIFGATAVDKEQKAIFINNASRFIAGAQKVRTISITVAIDGVGPQVLTFDTPRPLHWATAPSSPMRK